MKGNECVESKKRNNELALPSPFPLSTHLSFLFCGGLSLPCPVIILLRHKEQETELNDESR